MIVDHKNAPKPELWELGGSPEFQAKLKDIKEHPESHRHNFAGLQACCMAPWRAFGERVLELALMEAHEKYVDLGTNGGRKCDVISGPCACGATH